jgi:hypothetical protein
MAQPASNRLRRYGALGLAAFVVGSSLGVACWRLRTVPDARLFTTSPCVAPCWQGITPGDETSPDDVIAIIESLPYVRRISRRGPAIIEWFWHRWPWERSGYNTVYLQGTQVKYVSLSLDIGMTVGEVVDAFGIPEATTAVRMDHYVGLKLYYPTQGITFTAHAVPLDYPALDRATEVREVTYTAPAESLDVWAEDLDLVEHIRPWPGYGAMDLEQYALEWPPEPLHY